MECAICFENYSIEKYAVKLACSHIICFECSIILRKKKIANCPICLRPCEFFDDFPMSKTVEGMVLALQGERAILNNSHDNISIIIRNSKFKITEINASIKDTVLQLKEKIRNLEKIEISAQWLLHNGRALQNSSTLESAGIESGDVVYVVTRGFGR